MRYEVMGYLFSTDGLYSAVLLSADGRSFLVGEGSEDNWTLQPTDTYESALNKYGFDAVQRGCFVTTPSRSGILNALEETAREQW